MGGSGSFPNRYCKVCDGQSIVGIVLSPSTSVFPSQCHSTKATDPPSFTRYGRTPGTFKESSLIAEIREHWLENYFQILPLCSCAFVGCFISVQIKVHCISICKHVMGYPGVIQSTQKQCGLRVLIHEEGVGPEVSEVCERARTGIHYIPAHTSVDRQESWENL